MAPADPSDSGAGSEGTAAQGRALLAERIAAAPDLIAAMPTREPGLAKLLPPGAEGPRTLVATGIGTSEGHARHFAEVASRILGWPARFASTASLQNAPHAHAKQDWLVVFSQGLSANARHALRHAEAWGGCLVVTGLTTDMTEPSAIRPPLPTCE